MKNGLHAPLSDCKARRRAEISPIFKLQDDGENPSATSHSFLCEPPALKALKGIQKHDRHLAYKEQKQSLRLQITRRGKESWRDLLTPSFAKRRL